jgi:hypothetical protein
METVIKNKITYAAIVTFLLGVYGMKQETPVLMKDRPIVHDVLQNQWSEKTKQIVFEISAQYAFQYSTEEEKKDENILKQKAKRFVDFFSEVLPELQVIIHDGDQNSQAESVKIKGAEILKRIVGRDVETAFYIGRTIYLKKGYLLSDFIAETSHQLNRDYDFYRYSKYFFDYRYSGIVQTDMYDIGDTLEFQAHSLTEPFLRFCIGRLSKGDLNFSFSEVYDSYLKIYSSLVGDFRKEESQVWTIFFTLTLSELVSRDPLRLIKNVDLIIDNLKKIKNITREKNSTEHSYLDYIVMHYDFFEPVTETKIKKMIEELVSRKSIYKRRG